MICDQAIDNVEIDAPASASPGDLVSVRVTVLGGDGNPLEAVVPIEILLLDPAGKAAEFSGHYGAKDGVVTVKALIAPNDTPGLWRIQVRELASGLTADAYLSVRTGF